MKEIRGADQRVSSLPLKPVAKSQWQKNAVCFVETSGAPEVWTPNRRPSEAMMAELQRMCVRCPERGRCAGDALDEDAQHGVYAGVFLPGSEQTAVWNAAREQLATIADRPVGEPAWEASA